MSDIHTVAVGSLIALDPERPIREADVGARTTSKPTRPGNLLLKELTDPRK